MKLFYMNSEYYNAVAMSFLAGAFFVLLFPPTHIWMPKWLCLVIFLGNLAGVIHGYFRFRSALKPET